MSIANAGSDERGKYHGGSAGDQTGGEYRVRSWYNRPWNYVIRPNTKELGEMIAAISRAAANNDKIGYDQYQRNTYGDRLEEANWHPENITTKCETDCSNSTANAVKAAGYRLGISSLKSVSQTLYTGNIRKGLMNTGQFTLLTASKYLTSDKYLLPGDILLYENHHVAVNLTKGSSAGSYPNGSGSSSSSSTSGSSSSSSSSSSSTTKKYSTGTYKTTANLNLRAGVGTGSSKLLTIPNGTSIQVTSISGSWGKTTYSGKTGWCCLDYATRTGGLSSKKGYTGTFPTIPSRGYFKKGDRGENVKRLQRFLNWYGNYGLAVDGVVGSKTISAVRKYQSSAGLSVDGQFGSKSLAKAKTITK